MSTAPDNPLSRLTDAQRATLMEREQLVLAALTAIDAAARRGVGRLAALREFASQAQSQSLSQCSQSVRTLRRWLDLYAAGGRAALAAPQAQGRVRQLISPAAWEQFRGAWLSPNRPSIADCWRRVDALARREGWQWPPLKSIVRRVRRELPEFQSDYFRLGPQRWAAKYAPRIERDYDAVRANQVWIGDHHQFDVLVLLRGKPHRPWLTAWEDMRSRLLVGWSVVESPSSDSILSALRDGVLEHGAPEKVLVDNGKDFRAHGVSGGRPRGAVDPQRVASVCQQLQVEPGFVGAYQPQAKPIERCFGRVAGEFSKLWPSYCGRSPETRPEDLYARMRSDLLLPTLDEFSARWREYAALYNASPHQGAGMDGRSPLQAFAECDPIPRRTAPREVLDVLMRRTVSARVTRHGVRHDGVYYGRGNPDLWMLIGRDVLLRIDPSDRSCVLVCDARSGAYLATARNDVIRGSTTEDIRRGLARQRAAKRLAQAARPALADAHRPTVEHVIAAQAERLAALAPPALAAGAERGVVLLATHASGLLPPPWTPPPQRPLLVDSASDLPPPPPPRPMPVLRADDDDETPYAVDAFLRASPGGDAHGE